jgi:hypothetical protein
MALFPLGILSAAGAGGIFSSDYELIETQILGSSQSAITFSSLGTYSSTYKHLQIRWVARTDRPTFATDSIQLYYNGNTSNFTIGHQLTGNGSNVSSGDTGGATIGATSASQSPTNAYGAGVIDLVDIYATKNRVARSFIGQSDPAAGGFTGSRIFLTSALWATTTAITSVSLRSGTGASLLAGSRFSIYGVK